MGDPAEIDSGRSWEDQRSTYDALRARCAVAREESNWVALRHAEVVAAATDAEAFSSQVSARKAIPNSLDGTDHAAYRAVVDRYLTEERVAREEPQCRGHAAAIIDALPRGVTVKTIAQIGTPYAVRSQSTWLGWPADLEEELVAWIRDNHAATRSGDRQRTAEVAERFDQMIRALLQTRRGTPITDVTSELLRRWRECAAAEARLSPRHGRPKACLANSRKRPHRTCHRRPTTPLLRRCGAVRITCASCSVVSRPALNSAGM